MKHKFEKQSWLPNEKKHNILSERLIGLKEFVPKRYGVWN